jgi:hypothetical protein
MNIHYIYLTVVSDLPAEWVLLRNTVTFNVQMPHISLL